MKNIIEKIKDFIYYRICERYPVTEYAVGAVESLDDTIAIMDMCPWTFSPIEAVKLFLTRFASTAICIAITGVLWMLYGEEIATALFNASSMPSWMLPFCLFGAAGIFSRVLNEVLFTYE